MKKPSNKQAKKASKLAKAENLKNKANKIITVKNAEGDPDTTAEIVVQNKINYEPKVSVIIPVYNVEQYLRECLDSVCGQTLKEIEIICVDDGSTDSSLEILKEYASRDNRITVMKQANQGSGFARNNGIRTAKGEFIGFMDSDDLYPNKKTLQIMFDKAIKNNVLICGGSLSQIKEDKLITDSSQFEDGYSFKKEGIVEYKDYQFDYGYWRFIFNRIFLVENTLYFPDYLRQQDPPFFVKTMSLAERFYALNEPTYVYRVSYKQIAWNERKVVDLFKGIRDCLIYSKQYKLNNMHSRIAKRLNSWTFRTASATMVDNKNVRQQILQTLNTIDYGILKKEKLSLELDDIYKAIIQAQDNDVLVSIIIPCYNVAKYLPRCLNSVINQTFKSIEIICINDGSTDETLEVLEKYAKKDKRIKIINKKNGGLSSARNAGICEARGSFISFIDSDDWIDITTIEKATTKMSGNVDLVCYGAELVNEGLDENNLNIVIGSQYHKIKIIGEKIASSDNILKSTYTVWNKLFKKSILNKFGIKFAEGLLFEDNDYSIMYMVHCRNITYLDEYLYHYVQRPNSIMERLRAGSCDKTSDNLYIFDNLYKHLEKFDLLEKYQKVIASRFSIHLRAAYKYAPDNLKKKICILAKEITKKYRRDLFWGCVIENIQCSNFKKVQELTDIIVSLTSYPARIQTVNQTIESILNQSMKADKVVLWLALEQFPNKEKDLPKQLLDLCSIGLTIDWYHNICSYKKLIPALKKYPESIIVTADDDVIYRREWLEKLYQSYIKNTNVIHCHRARRIEIRNKKIISYKKWKLYDTGGNNGFSTFFTGVGGVLYPPHSLHADVLNEELYTKLCPKADDIWFWAMALLNDTKINIIESPYCNPKIIEGTQENALWLTNLQNSENDTQLANVLDAYPVIMEKLIKENKTQKIVKYKQLFFSSYLLFPYYLFRLYKLYKKIEKKYIQTLSPMRVDVKNEGVDYNDIVILQTNAKVSKPAWFKNKLGQGCVIETNATSSTIKIKAVNDGNLTFDFRASDKRYNGERFAVWVDYKSIKIDGKEILSLPIKTWHDKPFKYSMPIKDGQEIFVEIEQQNHEYTHDELKDIIIKLNLKNDDKLIDRIYSKYYSINIKPAKISPSIDNIKANAFISFGCACRPSYWLKKHNLRKVALPFDWMMGYSLEAILKTLKNGCSNWFDSYIERDAHRYAHRYVVDTVNNITSIHHFSKTKSVEEQLPSFKETFKRRGKRLQELLKTNSNICFLCNRSESISEIRNFLDELEKLYPNTNFTLINVIHSEIKKVEKYILSKKSTVYFVYDYDIHEKGGTPENPSFWIGNEKLWSGICNHLSLSKVFNNKNDVNRKYAINLLNNNVNEQTSDDDKFCISEKIFDIKNIKILSKEETIYKICEKQLSIARFGDGEINWMFTPNYKSGFQKWNKKMSQKLKDVFQCNNKKLLVCLAGQYKNNQNLSDFWKNVIIKTKIKVAQFANTDSIFGDTNITRDSRMIPAIKEIWKDKNIIIVEGETSRLGVGNDLFDNVKSIKRILCPSENAFDKYDKILKECKKQSKDKLFLIALGPTATILACDLSKLGYWALDIGHIDIVYEWALRGGEKVKIPGKYVNEVKDGNINIEDCTDDNYLNSIIANISRPESQKQPSCLFSITKYGNKKVYRILGVKFAFNNFKKDVIDNQEKLVKLISDMSLNINKEINTRTQDIEGKIKNIENKQADLANSIKKEISNIANLQNSLEAKIKADVKSITEATISELYKINDEVNSNKEKLVALEDLISNTNQQINEAIVSSINANSDNASKLLSIVKNNSSDISSEIAALYKEHSSQLQSLKEQAQSNRIDIEAKLDDSISEIQSLKNQAQSNRTDILTKFDEFGSDICDVKKDILDKCQDLDCSEMLHNLKEQAMSNRSDIFARLDNNSNSISEFRKDILNKYQELNYADLLHDSIVNSSWLKDKTFSLFGWAANYSFIYTLFRILDKASPKNILEMGLGQTTRLTSQYVAFGNNGAKLNVCEHDKNWIDIYRNELPKSNNIHLNHFELEYFDYEGKQNDKYKDMPKVVGDKKFDLIIVDGPVGGGKNLPRSNVIDLIPNNLAEDFVIIIDDSERDGEQTTIRKIKQKLNECNIKYSVSERRALKGQTIIMSTSREFVKFL